MKLQTSRKWMGILGIFLASSVGMSLPVYAKPVKSRSVKAAAKLKNHPPDNWIKHYLPEDRYKIAGNIWKVVSTETDKYYYRPNCPEMQRKPADSVIGFPSEAAALEAGYFPSPSCHPVASITPGAANRSGALTAKAQQIRLADGRSTVTLPAGWHKVFSQRMRFSMMNITADVFMDGTAKNAASITSMDLPRGTNYPPLTTAKAKEYMSQYQNSGRINSALPDFRQDVNMRDITFKGMKGVLVTPKDKSEGDGASYILQKGSRVYILTVMGKKTVSSQAKSIVNSYKPR